MALNYCLLVYFSPLDDPMAAGTDAFLQQWAGLQVYTFPPFALIRKVLNKFLYCQGTHLTLIAPFWPQKSGSKSSRVWLCLLQCPFHFGEIFSNSHISIAFTRTSLCFAFMSGDYPAICLPFRSLDRSPRSSLFATGSLRGIYIIIVGGIIGPGALVGDTPSLSYCG